MTGFTAEKARQLHHPRNRRQSSDGIFRQELVRGEPTPPQLPPEGSGPPLKPGGIPPGIPTAFAFVKDMQIIHPHLLLLLYRSRTGQKTPLLRSIDEVSREAVRILRLFGGTPKPSGSPLPRWAQARVFPHCQRGFRQAGGPAFHRPDFICAPAPKGQELDDHYFGAIRPRVAAYMKDLTNPYGGWAFSPNQTQRGGPLAQHEMAPIAPMPTPLATPWLVMEIYEEDRRKARSRLPPRKALCRRQWLRQTR